MKILTPIVILCASIAVNTLAVLMIVDIIDHFIDPYIILGIGLGVAFGASLGHIQMKKKNSSSEVK